MYFCQRIGDCRGFFTYQHKLHYICSLIQACNCFFSYNHLMVLTESKHPQTKL